MRINGIKVDVSKGFDVMRGDVVLRHFDSYAAAKRFMLQVWGRSLRYWADPSELKQTKTKRKT